MVQLREAGEPLASGSRQDQPRFLDEAFAALLANRRFVEEADNPHHPLLERLRFLYVSAADLDEFYRHHLVRRHAQLKAGGNRRRSDGLTAEQQLRRIRKLVFDLQADQARIWSCLRQELVRRNFLVLEQNDLGEKERAWLELYFIEQIFPLLTPVTIDTASPFPLVPDGAVTLVLDLLKNEGGQQMYGLLPLPNQLSRFIRLPEENEIEQGSRDQQVETTRFVRLETVVKLFVHELFSGCQTRSYGVFRLLRSEEGQPDNKIVGYMRFIGDEGADYTPSRVIRLEMEKGISEALRSLVIRSLQPRSADTVEQVAMVGLADLSALILSDRYDLIFTQCPSRYPELPRGLDSDIWAVIAQEELVLHHPFESFDVVLDLLHQAANDPDVLAVKWIVGHGPNKDVIKSLLQTAAMSGKSVTAILGGQTETVKQAFFQGANLECHDIHVYRGPEGLKNHARIGQIVRREQGMLKSYSFIGTGEGGTLRGQLCSDLSCLTAVPIIARDVTRIFNYLTSHAEPDRLKLMAISPPGLRMRVIDHIREEIYHAKAGRPAQIWMKMNDLIDEQLIELLYEASGAGVEIDLIIAGICCLRPGMAGLSEHIRVKTMIGPCREHARIYCFGAGYGLPSDKSVIYLGSADLTPYSLDQSIGVLVPVSGRQAHWRVQNQIMQASLADTEQSRQILSNGLSRRFILPEGSKAFNAHDYFTNNPGLSGKDGSFEEGLP